MDRLLHALAKAPLEGPAGRIELRRGPALADLPGDGDERVPSTDQSNTLVTIGDRLLVKAYRRLEAGIHPEVELGAALAGTRAPVPAFGGSLHWIAPDGADTAVALLQEFVTGAVSGWEEPIAAVAAALRQGRGAGAEIVAPYADAGAAMAALHRALIARLGARVDADAPARWHAEARAALAEAEQLEPRAARSAPLIRDRLAALDRTAPPRVSRIHGDLHFAQFLRTRDRMLIIDLEGNPMSPLDQRRRPDTPLRDLAALLRSIDHIGTAAARRAAGTDPEPFIAAAGEAARLAYGPADAELLHALELNSELRELVYAHRVVPEWLYAPQAGLARLLAP
jgi:maltokinase